MCLRNCVWYKRYFPLINISTRYHIRLSHLDSTNGTMLPFVHEQVWSNMFFIGLNLTCYNWDTTSHHPNKRIQIVNSINLSLYPICHIQVCRNHDKKKKKIIYKLRQATDNKVLVRVDYFSQPAIKNHTRVQISGKKKLIKFALLVKQICELSSWMISTYPSAVGAPSQVTLLSPLY